MRDIIVLDLQKSANEFSYTVRLRGRRGDKRSLKRTFQITDGGEPVNLTGKSVSFMAYSAGGDPIIETVTTSGSSGQFEYAFPDAVVSVEGESTIAYFKVEDTVQGWIGTTNSMSIEVLGDVALTDEVTGAYVPLLDQIAEAAEELSMNATTILENVSASINACNAAAANAREVAANAAEDLTALVNGFIANFTVDYDDLTDACKAQIAQSAASGVELVTQSEIDAAFEDTLLPIIMNCSVG